MMIKTLISYIIYIIYVLPPAIIIMTKISTSTFKSLTKIMLTQVRPPSADKEMKEMEVKSVSLTQIFPHEDVHCTLYKVI